MTAHTFTKGIQKMAEYFPLFRRAAQNVVLIIGGNAEADKKAQKLSEYPFDIVFCREKVTDIKKLLSDVSPDIVILADKNLCHKKELYALCCERRIEINTVDDAENSSFIFPSLVTKGKLSVAISTDGACPAAAAKLRSEIEKILPDETDAIIDQLAQIRSRVANTDGERRRIMKELCFAAFEKRRPLSDAEIGEIIKNEKNKK
ncbi:MAG: hypothetical protein E7656_08005 [Ruminococcaceae bacterium]|nr:hypothetical protein [Oscillospiraceae bacterium]